MWYSVSVFFLALNQFLRTYSVRYETLQGKFYKCKFIRVQRKSFLQLANWAS